jgi:hypothetical protein
VAAHDQRFNEADLLRLEGEVCAARDDRSGAVDRMRRAREVAQAGGAHWLERKATLSLSRLERGTPEERLVGQDPAEPGAGRQRHGADDR